MFSLVWKVSDQKLLSIGQYGRSRICCLSPVRICKYEPVARFLDYMIANVAWRHHRVRLLARFQVVGSIGGADFYLSLTSKRRRRGRVSFQPWLIVGSVPRSLRSPRRTKGVTTWLEQPLGRYLLDYRWRISCFEKLCVVNSPPSWQCALSTTRGRPTDGLDFLVLGRDDFDHQFCDFILDEKQHAVSRVACKHLITLWRRDGSLYESCRFSFKYNCIDSCVKCVLTLLFHVRRWWGSSLSAMLLACGLSVFQPNLRPLKKETFVVCNLRNNTGARKKCCLVFRNCCSWLGKVVESQKFRVLPTNKELGLRFSCGPRNVLRQETNEVEWFLVVYS